MTIDLDESPLAPARRGVGFGIGTKPPAAGSPAHGDDVPDVPTIPPVESAVRHRAAIARQALADSSLGSLPVKRPRAAAEAMQQAEVVAPRQPMTGRTVHLDSDSDEEEDEAAAEEEEEAVKEPCKPDKEEEDEETKKAQEGDDSDDEELVGVRTPPSTQ